MNKPMLASLMLFMPLLLMSLEPIYASSGPYLKVVTEYWYTPLMGDCPYGRVNLIVTIYKLKNDGVPSYDWYFYEVKLQTVPGMVACGSNWRTYYTLANQTVWNPGLNRWLVDYDPTTTIGTTTVSVTLTAAAGPEGPGASFSVSWSYSVADVQVYDKSDFSLHRALWEHIINPMRPAGMNTYLARPGFVVKTRQNYFSFVDANYKVWFVFPVTGGYLVPVVFSSGTIYLDAYEAGD